MTTSSRVFVLTRSAKLALDGEQPTLLAAVRDRLAALGSELVILCEAGVWSFHDGALDHDDQMVADGAMAAILLGARQEDAARDAVFVIDGASVVRVGATDDLVAALDAATELVAVRRVMTATTTADVRLLPAFDAYDSTESFTWSHV